MEKITVFDGQAFALAMRDIDTDQIIPARFLKMDRSRPGGYGDYLFHDLPLGEAAAGALERATILVAGANFGCGSSREGAVYALVDRGFRAVIAPSFGDIFHNNCLKNGLLPIRLDEPTVESLAALALPGRPLAVEVDLPRQQVGWRAGADKVEHAFHIDAFWRECLMNGQDEIALTLSYLPRIEAFEAGYFGSPLGSCPGTRGS
ncbi:3-isopropylmalate dehydratase small subunit [Bordetella petrii]|nr:3-isopropylmalate dehydratase small subunit [Bordetella petrii]